MFACPTDNVLLQIIVYTLYDMACNPEAYGRLCLVAYQYVLLIWVCFFVSRFSVSEVLGGVRRGCDYVRCFDLDSVGSWWC